VNNHTHIGVTSLQRIRNPRQHVFILPIKVPAEPWKKRLFL